MKELFKQFNNTGILVVGDLMVDQYIYGKVKRISPEAPVPVVEVNEETFLLGGAANVAHNVQSLGGKVFIAGTIGRDDVGKIEQSIEQCLEALPRNQVTTSAVPLIIDEFMTNAIYSAPLGVEPEWDNVRQRDNSEIVYSGDRCGIVGVAANDEYIFLECIDPYGTLVPQNIISGICQTYKRGDKQVLRDDETRGGGIGSRMIWDKCVTFGINVIRHNCAMVFCVIPYRLSLRKIANHPKSLHLMVSGE